MTLRWAIQFRYKLKLNVRDKVRNQDHVTRVAFTLVELIVVVAIISILASVILAALSGAIRAANSSVCLSNLRQLGAAAQLYSGDNDQRLIPMCTGTGSGDAVTWRIYMEPYLGGSNLNKNVFACPSDPAGMQGTAPYSQGLTPASYGMNEAGGRAPDATIQDYVFDYLNYLQNHHKTNFIKHPDSTIFLSDIGVPNNPTFPPSQWVDTRGPGAASYGYARFPNEAAFTSPGDDWNIYARHGGNKANALFFDGHAASVDLVNDIMAHPPGDPLCIYDNH